MKLGKLSDNEIIELAKKYSSKKELLGTNKPLYKQISKRNLRLEVNKFLTGERTFWTDQELLDIAKKYNSIKEFTSNDESVYQTIINRGLLDKATGHIKRQHTEWTTENIINELKNINHPSELKGKNASLYQKLNKEDTLADYAPYIIHKNDTYEIVQILEKGKIKEQPTLNGVIYEF